ncbi:hypothetical protein D3C85_723770 [compost metagenome]
MYQAQATVLHDQAQAIADLRIRRQRRVGDAQWQQATGGLLDATVGVAQQVVEGRTEQRLRTVIQAQANIGRVCRQCQRCIAAAHIETLGLRHPPAFTGRAQVHCQRVSGFAVLHQLGAPLAIGQFERRQRDVVDAAVEGHRYALFVAGVTGHQFGLERFLGLTEGEHSEVRFVAGTESTRPAPLQVQRFFRANELLLLSDLTVIGDGPGGDAPAGQGVGHLEGEAGFAVGIGQQFRLPRRRVDVFATRPLQHLHTALTAIGLARCTGAARQGDVITDERQTGAGAHVVAPWVIEELVDARRDFRLQGVDHFIDHADRQVRGNRFAGELGGQVYRDGFTRLIGFLIRGDGHVDLWCHHLDAGVLETVLAALGVQHREGQVRRETVLHRNARAVLGIAEFFHLQPVAAPGQQRGRFDLIALQRKQRIAHWLGESDQRQRFIACDVLGLVEDDFHGAGYGFDTFAGHRMAGGADRPAMIILERQVVGARPVKGQGETFVGCRELAFAGALVLQTHPAIAAWRNGIGLLAFAGVAEGNLVTHRAEALRRAQAEIRRATVDEDFLGGLDPIRRTVAGKHREHVATGLVRCRQVEGRAALGVGGQFGAGQFHRKLPEVLQFVVDHRQLLGAQAQAQFRIGHRFAVRVQQHQVALDRLAGAVILLGQIE